MDPSERLTKIVEDTGEVISVYGGFEIRVLKPTLFPWYPIVRALLEMGQEIWINRKKGKICILSEPEIR